MRIAIDVGSGFCKWRTNNNQGGFPSAVGLKPAGQDTFQVTSLDEDTVRFAEKEYLTAHAADAILDDPPQLDSGGEDAQPAAGQRISTLTRKWALTDGYLALLYRVIAAASPRGYRGRVALCVGLPQAYFAKDRPVLEKRLVGKHSFSVGSSTFEIEVARSKLWIIPQSMGVFFHKVSEDAAAAMNDQIGVVDVGTYTTGYSMVVNGRFHEPKSGGIELGIANLTDDLAAYIRRHHDGLNLPRATVTKALIRGKLRLHGKTQSLRRVVPEIADRLTDELVDALTAAWGDDSATASILVAGGGAPYVLKSMQRRWPHAALVSEKTSERVVVDGYFAYLAAQEGRQRHLVSA